MPLSERFALQVRIILLIIQHYKWDNICLDQKLNDAFPISGASVEETGSTLVRACINVSSGADQKSNGGLVSGGARDDQRRPPEQQNDDI